MGSEGNEAQLQVMCSSSFVSLVPDLDIKITLSVKRRAKRTELSRCDSTKASVPPKSGCGHAVSTSGHVLTAALRTAVTCASFHYFAGS